MGRATMPDGHIVINKNRARIKVTDHPAFGTGYPKRSQVVWWENTGYKPDWKNKREIVHHRNKNTLDDSFDNLELMTQGTHVSLHKPMLGKTHSAETKANYSSKRIGNKHRLGIKHSHEIKEQISKSLKKSWTPERRLALANRNRNKNGSFSK